MRQTLRPCHPLAAAAILWAAVLGPAAAQVSRPATLPMATPPRAMLACVILPSRTADIGVPAPGIVSSITVERGDTVHQGQILARMQSAVEEAVSHAAKARADSQADWRAAAAAEDLARQKLERTRSLQAQNFVSTQAVELAEAEHRVARERVAVARDQREVSAREAGGAEAQLSQRVVRAPFEGVVVERFANLGERFEEKPMFRIADISRLRVDVVANVSLFGRVKAGQHLNVQPELPGATARRARVVQVDRVLDPASNTFRVRLEMDNADGSLPAGLRCRADIEGASAPANPASQAERG